MAIQLKIRIFKLNGTVKFDPENLQAGVGDQIFWSNDDDEAHWPGKSGDQTFFMPNQIAPGSVSPVFTPGAADTIDYICTLHSDETGTITVT